MVFGKANVLLYITLTSGASLQMARFTPRSLGLNCILLPQNSKTTCGGNAPYRREPLPFLLPSDLRFLTVDAGFGFPVRCFRDPKSKEEAVNHLVFCSY